ncbi:DUF917 domain-containing protein [Curtobacterium sp. MCBD17_003]|uniref:DUF917 domain-containing protein n=1 Tax=Curtobacterium sp. MCBD17_003 TaxID=2175667 RepID=UPI000DA8542C|nr:DUF917 domain-containing protein [Curtobacterium sp. MCBD17_003]WIE54076.1 DUF917 domain-containing protein [Curtobacterium sp. MCBD17_003]
MSAIDTTPVAPLTVIGEDCSALARGAAILGTGGGGDPYIGRLLAEAAVRQHGPVPVVQIEDLPDDAVVLAVAMIGAPTVMVEKLPSATQFAEAVRSLAAYRGVTPTHLACIEVGGVNSTTPIVAAAELGLPLVDGDGMGRAFPEVQMVLPTLSGISATPMSLSDEKGNTAVFDTIDNRWAERLARTATVEMGCSAITSQYAMSGAEMKESYVRGSLSLCVRLGEALVDARAANEDPVAAVADVLGGQVVFAGKVTDVERKTVTGFARGTAHIAGMADDTGREAVLRFQNEHLFVEVDGRARATTPDLVITLDAETGEPITTEGLRFGARVRIVTAPADARWHSPAALELAGPRYFGYDLDAVRFDGTTSPGVRA